MKIRSGFVSNSSSSSFVLLIEKDIHDKIVGSLKDWEQEVFKKLEKNEEIINIHKFGKDLKVMHIVCSAPSASPHFIGIKSLEITKRSNYKSRENHRPNCSYFKNKNKENLSKYDFCPYCGSHLTYKDYFNSPDDAWGDYMSKIKKEENGVFLTAKMF